MFLGGLHRAERAIAGRLLGIAAGKLPWPYIDPDKALPWVERNTGLALAPGQVDAVRMALSSKVAIITGGPGVGKTTIVNSILRILAAKDVDLLLCAPTGRATKRMSEATGLEAKTIHRLLEVNPRTGGFRRDGENPLDCDLLVVDETSMVDVMLMRALLAAVPDGAALLIVGDVDQLPSVGPGQVLADIIASGAVPVVRLTEVFRQAAQSRIVTTAHGINRGAIPDLSRPPGDSDFYFVPAEDPETAAARIVELVKTRNPKRFGFDAMQDIQVLCPMNRGGAGARSLNIELQAALNPAGERKVERFGWTFAPGDKVMQIENDYDKEVYNGDIGLVADVDAEAGELSARFEGRDLVYGFGALDTLVPAYAATVHKSQGSEYPAVVIPVLTQHYAMLKRNLLYTGVTRGKRLVVLVGQKKAVAIAVRNVSGRRRWSKLDEWLALHSSPSLPGFERSGRRCRSRCPLQTPISAGLYAGRGARRPRSSRCPGRPSAAVLPSRPETIRTDLAVRPVRGPGRTFDLPADLVFAGEPWGWLGDAIPLVTAESGLQPHQLAALLRAVFFSPSDDADADSYDYGNQTSMESHTTKWLIMRDIWTLILSIVLTFSSLRVAHRGEQPCEHTQIIIGRYKQSLANMRTSCPSSTTIFDTLSWRIRQSAPIWVLRDTSLFGSKSTELS